jgi:hypothetical protein
MRHELRLVDLNEIVSGSYTARPLRSPPALLPRTISTIA